VPSDEAAMTRLERWGAGDVLAADVLKRLFAFHAGVKDEAASVPQIRDMPQRECVDNAMSS
jgi:hypothetical protein